MLSRKVGSLLLHLLLLPLLKVPHLLCMRTLEGELLSSKLAAKVGLCILLPLNQTLLLIL